MDNKTLILTVDVGRYKHDWEVSAMSKMLSDYFDKNKILEKSDNLVIFPTNEKEMKIFWLEGDPNNLDDVKSLEELKGKIKPVMETALGIQRNPNVKKP